MPGPGRSTVQAGERGRSACGRRHTPRLILVRENIRPESGRSALTFDVQLGTSTHNGSRPRPAGG